MVVCIFFCMCAFNLHAANKNRIYANCAQHATRAVDILYEQHMCAKKKNEIVSDRDSSFLEIF